MTPAPTRPRLMARFRAWFTVGLALLGGSLIASVRPILQRPPLLVGQDGVPPGGADKSRVSLDQAGGPVLNIQPADGVADTILIFYPGGLVRPQAYEWLGRALSTDGVQTVIPAFPLDLAVLSPNRADLLIDRYGKGRPVVIAGHSLGGAMAAQYASRHVSRLSGLILMAAYPAGNLSLRGESLPVLSLLAARDGVAEESAVRGALERLPPGTSLEVVPGAVHAFFGRYGPQRGDGVPLVTRAQAEAEILKAVRAFLDGLPRRVPATGTVASP